MSVLPRVEGWVKGPAVLVGLDNYARFDQLARLLRLYGCREIVGLTDAQSVGSGRCSDECKLIPVPDMAEPSALANAAAQIEGFDSVQSPFICVQDAALLSYLEARDKLLAGRAPQRFVDSRGMRLARIKPLARARWNRQGVDPTRWAILEEGLPHRNVEHRLQRAGLLDSRCIVKPIAGMGSAAVTPMPVTGVEAIAQAAERVYGHWAERLAAPERDRRICIEETEFAIYKQALVEEFLEGPEYTVDGIVQGDQLRFAVQHKETRHVGTFVGDGLIVAPPDVLDFWAHQASRQSPPSERQSARQAWEFESLLRGGLAAIELRQWVFHAEVISTESGLRFVELNPRPPGGLLSRTASMHVGIDLFEAVIRFHLGIDVPSASFRTVTGQFPIYADQPGVIVNVRGIEAAKRLPCVESVELATALPFTVTSVDQENYAVFISLRATNHTEIRAAAQRVRETISLEYAPRGHSDTV